VDCILCGTQFDFSRSPCPQCGWDPSDLCDSSGGYRPGELIRGRYEMKAPLGVGRLGATLGAVDVGSGEVVAVKVVHPCLIPTEEFGRRFLIGVRKLVWVENEVMGRVLDVNREGSRYFVVFEHLDGVPLRRVMETRRGRGQGFEIGEIQPILEQTATLLGDDGIPVHGSLSPENMWIFPKKLALSDAGLATHLPPAAVGHRLRARERTAGYVAPEVARGAPSTLRSDVYALGVLVGEMLTQVAVDGRPEIFGQSDPDLSAELDGILRRALLSDPRGRYESPGELLEAIAEVTGIPTTLPAAAGGAVEAGRAQDETLDDLVLDLVEGERESARERSSSFSLGSDGFSDATQQVSMDDVIRAHVEHLDGSAREGYPVPLVRPSSPPPSQGPPAPASVPSTRATLPPPPGRGSRASPPAARDGAAAVSRPIKSLSGPKGGGIAPPPARRSSVPPPARRSSAPPPPRRPSAPPPAPRRGAGAAVEKEAIAPRRPASMKRDSVPPPPAPAPPPAARRADRPDEEDTAVERLGRMRLGPPREVTQEIDLDALESMEEDGSRREVTQEVDLEMIQAIDSSSMGEALSKLERQAKLAERASSEELIQRAHALDGVDPRFVRAAHSLESDRRGARSKQAAEMLKERADDLDGIDPRLLRAAARLEEARISRVPTDDEIARQEYLGNSEEEEADWRDKVTPHSEDSVISFLAPPVVDRTGEVRGLPHTRRKSADKGPPAPPPRPPTVARGGRRREPRSPRALYDDSGETDDESQVTALVQRSRARGRRDPEAIAERLNALEGALPIAIGVLLAAMAVLLALAASSG